MMETRAEERSGLEDRLEWRLARERAQARVREEEWEGAFIEEMSGQLEVSSDCTGAGCILFVPFVVRPL